MLSRSEEVSPGACHVVALFKYSRMGRAQQQVVALDDDILVAGADSDVALNWVAHAVVKGRHTHLAYMQATNKLLLGCSE